jgi:hypothetical protein
VYGLLPSDTLNSTATFSGADAATEGSWGKLYGADGYELPTGAGTTPAYASFSAKNTLLWTWTLGTSDPRAINGQASAWYNNGSTLSFDINLTDGQAHQIALYLLDWDSRGRSETIAVTDAATGTVLDSQLVSNFSNGVYYRWKVSGNVVIVITPSGGPNGVVSGIFFGGGIAPRASASFVKSDTSTQGNWQTIYGTDGYSLAGGAQSIPPYATLAVQNQQTWTWAPNTSDPRALQTSTGRIAGAWYSGSSFSFNLNLDANPHQIALYALDWDSRGRAEIITITDASTGALLDSENLSNFANGVYLVWTISGNVVITVTPTAMPNGVVSGIFFGSGGAPSLSGTILLQLPSGVTAAVPGSMTIAPNQSQQITVTIINGTGNPVAVTAQQ